MTRLFLLLCLLLTPSAMAGEVYLGAIVSAAGADTTNASTAAPFAISPTAKLTMVCTAAAFICAAPPRSLAPTTACTASLAGTNPGLPVNASEKFPTSANGQYTVTVSSSRSAVVRIVGTAAVTCYVWERSGTE